jgi:uncharacterized protein YvpB
MAFMRRSGLKAWLILAILLVFATLPARADDLPESAYVNGVVGHAQTYTLSCESRSAADWAVFWGVSISEGEFLNRLPRSDNPELGFVGDPYGPWGATPPYSYGVHAQPVADLLGELGLEAHAHRGLSWDDARAEIAEGRPVIVWVIGGVWPGSARIYDANDGSDVTVAAYEHTMILVGYDTYQVYLVDSGTGYTITATVGAFLRSWGVLENMAVTGGRREEPPPPPPPPPPAATLTPTLTALPTATPWPTPNATAVAALLANPSARIHLPVLGGNAAWGNPAYRPDSPATGLCLVAPGAAQGWCVPAAPANLFYIYILGEEQEP